MTDAILSHAIASLQERVRDLEADNGAYRREIALLRLKINSTTQTQTGAESHLLGTADDTIHMLASATETLTELRNVKHENRRLVQERQRLDVILGKLLRRNTDLKLRISALCDKATMSMDTQREYDSLILDILTPSRFPKRDSKPYITYMHSSTTKETFSFPAKIQMLLQELQTLPADFSGQRIDVKRRIIATLANAREMIDGLREEIELMKLEAVGTVAQRRIGPAVEQRLNYIDCITRMMGRFHTELDVRAERFEVQERGHSRRNA
jgi:chromosome segregation ATPase